MKKMIRSERHNCDSSRSLEWNINTWTRKSIVASTVVQIAIFLENVPMSRITVVNAHTHSNMCELGWQMYDKQIFNSIPFLKSRGMLWVWSWNDMAKMGFQRSDTNTSSPFQPPLFFMQKSIYGNIHTYRYIICVYI